MNAFRNTAINFEWSAVNDIPDCEDAFSFFYSNLVEMFDKHFPVTKMKSR